MTNISQIEICLNCPLPECIADDRGCKYLGEATSAKETEKIRKQDEISAIQKMLPQFDYSIPTKSIIEVGINKNRIDLLKRRGLIQTMKIHSGRGGLRVVATSTTD